LNKINKKIPLGQILKPHGIKGELKILFYNEESNSLKNNQIVFLESKEGVCSEYKIERILYSFRKNRIKFFDINTIDEANQLRGYTLNVLRSDLPKLSKNEYYLDDLIGYTMMDSNSKVYGKVNSILSLPANDVLSIMHGEKEYLIPLIQDVVIDVDQEKEIITIDPLEGLFN
tara:strand:- start:224 stop:742 length:519 start_codon:yes stop_codon:yes gene_type:complete